MDDRKGIWAKRNIRKVTCGEDQIKGDKDQRDKSGKVSGKAGRGPGRVRDRPMTRLNSSLLSK